MKFEEWGEWAWHYSGGSYLATENDEWEYAL